MESKGIYLTAELARLFESNLEEICDISYENTDDDRVNVHSLGIIAGKVDLLLSLLRANRKEE